ncbi:hypothetical protein, partial [Leclercia adecarboxylata]|uniref:hypothetical protein n=1 Tax=Leclercia adecarboxylata TaxID=83655 RepID=UPI00234D4134
VTHELNNHSPEEDRPDVSYSDVSRAVEKALVKNNAYDLARSFVNCYANGIDPYTGTLGRSVGLTGNGPDGQNGSPFNQLAQTKSFCRVIRRNGELVGWNEQKINVAVRKAFLSQSLDTRPAEDVVRAVSKTVRDSGK